MSSNLLKRVSLCAVALLLCASSFELLAQTPPAVDCKTSKKQCKTAAKRSKKDVKTMNKESGKLEKLASTDERYLAKRNECRENLQQAITNQKINAQPYAQACGNGVFAAVESAQIWSVEQLGRTDFNEADSLMTIDTSIIQVLGSLANALDDYLARLLDLPTACVSINSIGDVPNCVSAALTGEGCSSVEQCGYINVPDFLRGFPGTSTGDVGDGNPENVIYKIPGKTFIGTRCGSEKERCKAEKEARRKQEQQIQIQACERIKQLVRNVTKMKIKINRCDDRLAQSRLRLNSKINASKLRYCTAKSAYEGTDKPTENTSCSVYESASCGGARPYYDAPQTTTVTCG